MFRIRHFLVLFTVALSLATHAAWRVEEVSATPEPGKRIDVTHGDQMVAQFIFGEGQLKPYLHVYGREGDLLTKWTPDQQFPHHRGIYIGWNKIQSDRGSDDLWHLRSGEKFEVIKVREAKALRNGALIEVETSWRSKRGDASNNELIREIRRMHISRTGKGETQVDVNFHLKAARDLKLDGDLQHAGIHFRGSADLSKREAETSYVWEPPIEAPGGKGVSSEFKWARLIFPVGENWYSATEFNAPSNPVEELSWRAYGRFGFFFKRDLKKDEELRVDYRFITKPAKAPAAKKHTEEELKAHRSEAEKEYKKFVKAVSKNSWTDR